MLRGRMHRRRWIPIALLLLIFAAVLAAVLLRKHSPPEPARLLPEADGIVYLNLKPLRAVTHFDKKPVEHDAEYQAFIDATGIEAERDLDEAAFALSRRENPKGPDGPLAYTEVFAGHFDNRRLIGYLSKAAVSRENYAGSDIYIIPHAGRTVRVAVLGVDMVAASNAPSPEQIHAVLDRYHSAALSFTGSSLLKAHYTEVPLLSMAWAISRGDLVLLPMQQWAPAARVNRDSVLIASARYVRSLQVRVEELAATAEGARDSAESLKAVVAIVRALEGGSDAEMQEMLRSVTVEQTGNRAVVKATVPVELLERMVGQPGAKTAAK